MAPTDPKVFTLTELETMGGKPLADGTQFVWVASKTIPLQLGIDSPADPVIQRSFQGAFACPRRPWTRSGKLRTNRTDYPGAKTPSEQVLGPNHEPFSLDGRWDDRYNFEGFAVQTEREFEAMCRRGNPVRIQFEQLSYDGLITEWNTQYFRSWDIRYEFTVSVHIRSNDSDLATRSPDTPRNARQIFDDMGTIVEAIRDADTDVPSSYLATDLSSTIGADIFTLEGQLDALELILEARERAPNVQAIDPFRRLATATRAMQTTAQLMNLALLDVKPTNSLGPQTAVSVLLFETWSRSIRYNNRILINNAFLGSRELDERADPNAIGLYRPHKGESLYNVSRLFYGTPFGWRLIAERNNIPGIQLTGDELLIIPERAKS